MKLLIDKSDIAKAKDISVHTTLDRINEYIADSQTMDLCKLLGYDFYFDILKNYSQPDYQDLINGVSFDNNGCEWQHEGLRRVLVEFSYGRYTYFGGFNDTPNGNTIKTFEFSTPTPNEDRKDIWKENKQRANAYFEPIKKYLDLNTDKFPKWNESCNSECDNKKTTGFKYDVI